MKKNLLFLLVLMVCMPVKLVAFNLAQVFQDALDHDATFKAAGADFLAKRQTFPIARSDLLPHLDFLGDIYKYKQKLNAPNQVDLTPYAIEGATTTGSPLLYQNLTQTIRDTGKSYTLNLTQTVFNYSQWANLKNARAIVKQAVATYDAEFQDLITRTAAAYFAVLNASDNLSYKKAQEKELANKLNQYKERYKVGLIAVTDVYDTQAEYERVVAEKIEAQNTLENNLESLRVITGKIYPALQGPSDSLPLITPQPGNIEQWVEVSQKQNYRLLSAYYEALAARERIGVEFGQGLPNVNVKGSYNYTKDSDPAGLLDSANTTNSYLVDGIGSTTSKTARIDLNIAYPIYQGGKVTASTRQANYNYQRLDAQREKILRDIIANTRKSYLGVISSMSQVRAYKQSVKSSLSSLESNEAGYLVGTKTILDVLSAQSNLYENRKSYSERQYTYLNNILELKKAAGILSPQDIDEMNSWLDRKASFRDSYLVKSTLNNGKNTLELPSPKRKLNKRYKRVKHPPLN